MFLNKKKLTGKLNKDVKENIKHNLSRRGFLKGSTLSFVAGSVAAGSASQFIFRSDDSDLLRPPGALDESTFLASCIKCGQCVQVCPPQILSLAGLKRGFGIGTPYLVPREGACILCKGLPCVLSCPTGALNHDLTNREDANMGLAVLRSPKTCLAINGKNDIEYRLKQIKNINTEKEKLVSIISDIILKLETAEKKLWLNQFNFKETEKDLSTKIVKQVSLDNTKFNWILTQSKILKQSKTSCRICLEKCPIKHVEPIKFSETKSGNSHIPVIQESCVGCGICEEVCPVEDSCIKIIPRLSYKSKDLGHQDKGHV